MAIPASLPNPSVCPLSKPVFQLLVICILLLPHRFPSLMRLFQFHNDCPILCNLVLGDPVESNASRNSPTRPEPFENHSIPAEASAATTCPPPLLEVQGPKRFCLDFCYGAHAPLARVGLARVLACPVGWGVSQPFG